MDSIKKGYASYFYNPFSMEAKNNGVVWAVADNESPEKMFEIKEGDYVVIKDGENVLYEDFVFYTPYTSEINYLMDKKMLTVSKNGYPIGFSFSEWERIFMSGIQYDLVIKSNKLSNKVFNEMKERAFLKAQKEYESSKIKGFSKAVEAHMIQSKDFFNEEVNDYTGFSKAFLEIKLVFNSIGDDYYFIIEESVQDTQMNKSGIILADRDYNFEDFLVPEMDSKFLKNYVEIYNNWIQKGAGSYDDFFEAKLEFESEFKKSVKKLPVYKKYSKGKTKSAPSKLGFYRCIKVPKELHPLFK